MVVILNQLSASDIHTYDAMLDTLLPGAYLRLPVRKTGAGKLGALGAFPVLPRHHPHKRKPGQVLSSVTSADIARAIKSAPAASTTAVSTICSMKKARIF